MVTEKDPEFFEEEEEEVSSGFFELKELPEASLFFKIEL